MKTDRAESRNESGGKEVRKDFFPSLHVDMPAEYERQYNMRVIDKWEKRRIRSIYIQFAFAAVIIGAIAAMWLVLYGWLGMVLYLLFAAACLILVVLAARRLLKRYNAIDNRIMAAEHALDEIDKRLNPEEE